MPVLKAKIGGVWVPLGAGGTGNDEVEIGPNIPTAPGIELWYDTDDPQGAAGGVPAGGTLGQVLTKIGNEDYNVGWVSGSGPEGSKPAAPSIPGFRYFATDTMRDWLWDGIGWTIMGEPEQTYAVSYTNITVGNGTSVGRYHRSDGWVDFWLQFTLGSTSAMGTGPFVSIPFSPRSPELTFTGSASQTGVARTPCLTEVQSGTTCQVRVANTNAQITATVPFTWANTHALFVHGRYQMGTRYS